LRPKTLGLCLSLLAAASGCDGPARPAPAVVRFSALPDQTPDRVLTQHKAVVEEVCRIARVSCAWVPAPSYHGLVAAFGRGEIDVAFFGGVTFAQARHRFGAVPLAMRKIEGGNDYRVLKAAIESALNQTEN
jgi:phosphonate transport system substrate-binding protein